jgi:hypothetical protein
MASANTNRVKSFSEFCETEDFPVEFVRQVQEQGCMLAATIKCGSQVLEIYTPLDVATGRTILHFMENGVSLCEAIHEAELNIMSCYGVAASAEADYELPRDVSKRRELLSRLRVKKLLDFPALCKALKMESDAVEQLLATCAWKPLSLDVPWGTIPFYTEEDYLRLRMAKRIILEEGMDIETALQSLDHFALHDLWLSD